jgi:hypothetical protein
MIASSIKRVKNPLRLIFCKGVEIMIKKSKNNNPAMQFKRALFQAKRSPT